MVKEDIQNQERHRNQKYCFSWTNFRVCKILNFKIKIFNCVFVFVRNSLWGIIYLHFFAPIIALVLSVIASKIVEIIDLLV
jgi:hypothetical protein